MTVMPALPVARAAGAATNANASAPEASGDFGAALARASAPPAHDSGTSPAATEAPAGSGCADRSATQDDGQDVGRRDEDGEPGTAGDATIDPSAVVSQAVLAGETAVATAAALPLLGSPADSSPPVGTSALPEPAPAPLPAIGAAPSASTGRLLGATQAPETVADAPVHAAAATTPGAAAAAAASTSNATSPLTFAGATAGVPSAGVEVQAVRLAGAPARAAAPSVSSPVPPAAGQAPPTSSVPATGAAPVAVASVPVAAQALSPGGQLRTAQPAEPVEHAEPVQHAEPAGTTEPVDAGLPPVATAPVAAASSGVAHQHALPAAAKSIEPTTSGDPAALPTTVPVATAATAGPAATQQSAPVSAPVVPPQVLAAQLAPRAVAAALAATRTGLHTIHVQLRPAELGTIQLVATMGDDGLRLHLHAASDATREVLRSALGDLRADLTDGGITRLSSLDVSDRAPDQQPSQNRWGATPPPLPDLSPDAVGGAVSPAGRLSTTAQTRASVGQPLDLRL